MVQGPRQLLYRRVQLLCLQPALVFDAARAQRIHARGADAALLPQIRPHRPRLFVFLPPPLWPRGHGLPALFSLLRPQLLCRGLLPLHHVAGRPHLAAAHIARARPRNRTPRRRVPDARAHRLLPLHLVHLVHDRRLLPAVAVLFRRPRGYPLARRRRRYAPPLPPRPGRARWQRRARADAHQPPLAAQLPRHVQRQALRRHGGLPRADKFRSRVPAPVPAWAVFLHHLRRPPLFLQRHGGDAARRGLFLPARRTAEKAPGLRRADSAPDSLHVALAAGQDLAPLQIPQLVPLPLRLSALLRPRIHGG